jgi:hypothetical protein
MYQYAKNHNPFYATTHDGDQTQFDLGRYQAQFGEFYTKTMMCEVHHVCRSDWIEFRDDFLKPVVALGAAIVIGPQVAEFVGDFLMSYIPASGAALSPTAVAVLSAGAGGFAAGTTSNYILTGDLSQALKAGLISGLSGAGFNYVGTMTTTYAEAPPNFYEQFNPVTGQEYVIDTLNPLTNTFGHMVVGCISGALSATGDTSAATGCTQGAAGAGAGAAAGHFFNAVGATDPAGQFFAATIGGGLGSVAAGGDFWSGSINSAMGYLVAPEKFISPVVQHVGNPPTRGLGDMVRDIPTSCQAKYPLHHSRQPRPAQCACLLQA